MTWRKALNGGSSDFPPLFFAGWRPDYFFQLTSPYCAWRARIPPCAGCGCEGERYTLHPMPWPPLSLPRPCFQEDPRLDSLRRPGNGILRAMVKVYCEHGALIPDLVALQRQGVVELLHFPYDPDSRSRHLRTLAVPSEAQWSDLNISWSEDVYAWNDHRGSQHLGDIRRILGPENRRDALHIDSAHKSGCRAFVTRDTDILDHRRRLEGLLAIRFFHPDEDKEALLQCIHAEDGAA